MTTTRNTAVQALIDRCAKTVPDLEHGVPEGWFVEGQHKMPFVAVTSEAPVRRVVEQADPEGGER